jgi:hypothetical protein
MKYNLLIRRRMKVESSSINANKAIIKEIRESNPIPTKKESRNSKNGQIPNRGNFPSTKKISTPQNNHTTNILISVFT